MKITKEQLKKIIREEIESVVDAAGGGSVDPLQRLAAEHEKSLKTIIGMYNDHDIKYGGRERKQFRDVDLKSAFEAAFKKVAVEQDPQTPVDDILAGRSLDQVPAWASEYMNNMYDDVVRKATEELGTAFKGALHEAYPQAGMDEMRMSMKVPTQELKRVERSMMGGKYITFTKRQLANIIVSVNGQEHYLAKLLEEYDDTMYPPEDSEKTHFPPATIEDLDVFLEDVVTYGQGRMTQEQKQAALDKVNALMREEGLGIEGAIEEVLDDLGIT